MVGGGAITSKAGSWDVTTSDSLYAVTNTTTGAGNTTPGTFVAAVQWGNETALPASSAGASVINFASTNRNNADVGVINTGTAGSGYGSVSDARAAYTNVNNWLQDNKPTDATGSSANAEWPALSDSNSPLNGKTTLVVDNTAPTVTSIAASGAGITNGSGALNAGDVVTLTVNVGEAVIVTGTPTLSLSGGGSATYTSAGSTPTALKFTYTVGAGQNTEDLAVTAISGTVKDGAGNALAFNGATTGSPAGTLVIDTTPDTNVAVNLTDAVVSGATASVKFDLTGLDAGSQVTVRLRGSGDPAGVHKEYTYTSNGSNLTADVTGLKGDITATIVSGTDRAGNTASGTGDTQANDPVCFYPGTLVATPSGEVPVESLRAGDLALTADGRAAPVRWLGRQTVSTRFADPLRVLPVRIAAGALGDNLPTRDLLVSPEHALLVDGVLAQAGALVNGTTIRREAAVPEVFTYWHVELSDHSLILAEGVPAETFIDNVARLAFDNWDEHEAAGSEAPIAEMALPRAKSARQVPQATRRRLAERAALLLGAQTAAA